MADHSPTSTTHAEHAAHDHHGASTTIFGRTLPYPLYTVIFFGLALVTVIEVIIAELPEGLLGTLLLIVLSLGKAVAVVYWYMHLNRDSKLYALALILPVFIALVSVLFLLAVPTTGY
jgi:caa(3)-type oxidase subunit IV